MREYMAMAEPADTAQNMMFTEYVKALPHQWVFDNLIRDADKSRRILSSAMLKDAAAKFVTKASLSKRFKALSPAQRLKCSQIYMMGKHGLSIKDSTAYAKEPLLSSLFVYAAQYANGFNGHTLVRLFGFEEFEPVLRPLMAETLFEAAVVDEYATQTASCLWRPLNDISALCSLAFHRQLKRSTHGGLARPALNALKRITNDPTMTGKSIPENAPGHPSGFLISFCLNEELIIDTAAEFLLNRKTFDAWLCKSMKERLSKLSEYAVEYLGCFGLDLLCELLLCSEGRLISVDALAPEPDKPILADALYVFEFLGHLNTSGTLQDGNIRFSPHKPDYDDVDLAYSNEQKRDTLIMPDFSVVIPQEVSPAELFDFSKIGILVAFDKVYKGKITKESVSNALSAGVSDTCLREWLSERSASENVVKTIYEWIREFSRLFVSPGPTLVSSNEKVTKQLTSLEQLRRHITAIEAHTVFAIRPGSEQAVMDILNTLGFDSRQPGGQANEPSEHKGYTDFRCAGAEVKADTETEGAETPEESGYDNKVSERPAKQTEKRWNTLIDFASVATDTAQSSMNRTKYGTGLKALAINEIVRVADYALLTNQEVKIDYAGSAHIKQGIYTVMPLSVNQGIDSAVEAEIPYVRGRKLFLLEKIKRFGVAAQ